ncbi:hypothetical protein B6N60_02820 [Richelia sinica FACHB-800]|uniref:Uncharacterized protein n=1 Tax=Richelia sinica FACHB-800 TaxID=1357546 RepID=A0A975TA10_9NOST|nr:hypothetical protein B6N60_02820 [Richelia sinica FACHB-800]
MKKYNLVIQQFQVSVSDRLTCTQNLIISEQHKKYPLHHRKRVLI